MFNSRGLAGLAALVAVAIAVALGAIVTSGVYEGEPKPGTPEYHEYRYGK